MNNVIEDLIMKYNLEKHPEGGYFNQTYCSKERIETENGVRAASTAIMFLLSDKDVSHLHRLKSDEMWHFYEGDELCIVEIDESGKICETKIGNDNNNSPQYLVKRGRWFGSFIAKAKIGYSLVGCTVCPGFDYDDFELGDKSKLLEEYGKDEKSKNLITKLTT